MHQQRRHDVIVVGGGPAGSSAASLLSRSGAKVLLLERQRPPREKLCAGLLTEKTRQALERIFSETPATVTAGGILLGHGSGYRMTFCNRPVFSGESRLRFDFVERSLLDARLLDHARESGARVETDQEVVAVDPLLGEVRTASGASHRASVVIGADGVNSRVRRCFPPKAFSRKQWRRGLAASVEIVGRPGDFSRFDTRLGVHFGIVDQGYAWTFPVGGRVVVGMCALRGGRGGKNIAQLFREFLETAGYTGEERFRGHPLPYGNYMGVPVYKRVFLAGDAAGFADPLLGEGIFYALRSAELAANSLCQTGVSSHSAYVKAVAAHLLPDLYWARKTRGLLLLGMKTLGPAAMGRMLSMGRNRILEIIHGRRGFTGGRKPAVAQSRAEEKP